MKYLMYGCKQVEITQPNGVSVSVDECLKSEIKYLWGKGIKTTGCCCGHGFTLGFIQVEKESVSKMKKLGYQHYLYVDKINDGTRRDAFIPKTYLHHTEETVNFKYEIKNLFDFGERV